MLNSIKQGSIFVDKSSGTFHVVCYNMGGKVYATGTDPRPTRNFKKNFIHISETRLDTKGKMLYNIEK